MNVANNLKILKAKGTSKNDLISELKEEGYQSFEWSDSPGSHYPPHSHEYDECICMIDGKISFYIDNQEYKLASGEKLYLPAGTIHEARNKSNEKASYLVGELA